nr:hypothetical protein [Azospirillum sp. SYSU D00513]
MRRRLSTLVLALAVYGALSVPAPPELRFAELAIGALLALTAGLWRPLTVVTGHALRGRGGGRDAWELLGILALAWLLWVPLLRGAWQGWSLANTLRDVVPLLYLFLPVMLVPVLRRARDGAAGRPVPGLAVDALALGLMLAGFLFVLRWWRQAGWEFEAVGARAMADGSAYVLNAPSVLFAAVGLPFAAAALARRGGMLRWGLAMLFLSAGLLCLAALAGAVHRVALGLAALAFLAVGARWAARVPLTMLLLAPVAGGLGWLFAGTLLGAVDLAIEKTRVTGANGRWEEAAAVLAQISRSPWSFLFGDGWGALVENPAVGGWRVSYTHTLVSYILAKAGALGLVALLAYFGAMAVRAAGLLRANPPLAWALLAPLAMALGLHTSFKYLDTGLLLTLMMLAAEHRPASVR